MEVKTDPEEDEVDELTYLKNLTNDALAQAAYWKRKYNALALEKGIMSDRSYPA